MAVQADNVAVKNEIGEYLSDIVTAGAENGEGSIADTAPEGTRRPSDFICQISGSMALRRLSSFARVRTY